MMEEMKRSGVDGCRGVLGSFQNERVISYEDMKAALAEVSDGLPGESAETVSYTHLQLQVPVPFV